MNILSTLSPSRQLVAWLVGHPLSLLLLVVSLQVVSAQQPVAPLNTNNLNSPVTIAPAVADDRYRIGPGDVLSINILDRPELSGEDIRVDSRGMILMPLIEGEIQAACLTEGELSRAIAARYSKYLKEPQVKVFIKEYQSQPVAVIGAVNAPGRFQLQRRVRLLELLTFAGGPAERAGRSLQVIHAGAGSPCEASMTGDADELTGKGMATFKLDETMRGTESQNPFVQSGDIITIPDAEQFYVLGNVFKPSAYPLRESITISQAIAMAGGIMPDSKVERVRIVRQAPGSATKTEIYVNLKAIDKQRSEDIALQANDIVDVPKTSGGAKIFKDVLRTLIPSVTQYPVRVIR